MAAQKRRPPKLIPLEAVVPQPTLLVAIPPGPPRLAYLRPLPGPAFVATEVTPGDDYWLVGLLNENTSIEYTTRYVSPINRKSKVPWAPQELAIECARRLNEYRGLVTLQEHYDGVCTFAATFASNSLWTFCVWSTDSARVMPVKATPDGWRSGQPFPTGLKRVEVTEYPPPGCHHPDRDPAKYSKLAQRQFP